MSNRSSGPAGTAEIQSAQRYVGAAMVSCLGFWFAPFVSGVATAMIESALIDTVLKIMGCYSKAASAKVYWFFRQKTFFLLGGTYIPILGVPLQLFETYGIGQFAIHCALRPELLTDDAWLEQSWKEVAPDILSGDHAIQSYEQFTGTPFPDYARTKFIATVNFINQLYLYSQKFPGAARAQKGLAKVAQEATRVGAALLTDTAGVIAAGASSLAETCESTRKKAVHFLVARRHKQIMEAAEKKASAKAITFAERIQAGTDALNARHAAGTARRDARMKDLADKMEPYRLKLEGIDAAKKAARLAKKTKAEHDRRG